MIDDGAGRDTPAEIKACGEGSFRDMTNMKVISMGDDNSAALDVLGPQGRIALTATDFVL